eukprot:c36960_g1_i1 orf=485-919(-)
MVGHRGASVRHHWKHTTTQGRRRMYPQRRRKTWVSYSLFPVVPLFESPGKALSPLPFLLATTEESGPAYVQNLQNDPLTSWLVTSHLVFKKGWKEEESSPFLHQQILLWAHGGQSASRPSRRRGVCPLGAIVKGLSPAGIVVPA